MLHEQGIQFLLPEDPLFPAAFTRTEDPPFAIFLRGLPIDEGLHVAVVGTRNMTSYGKQATRLIAEELAHHGATVVSGFALGIDMTAHTACLDAGGRTIGVLPCGIENASIVPRAHFQFAQRMLAEETGTLLSEYPPGTPIRPFHFLIRNRLVAALSEAVVVTEGDHDSGALVTARLALEIGREVLAVPGSIFFPSCRGTNTLIADGARPCRSAADVFTALGFKDAERAKHIADARQHIAVSPDEARVLAALTAPHSIDELSRLLQEPVAKTSTTVSILELKGRIISVGPRTYICQT
jgi:DNA processing protein